LKLPQADDEFTAYKTAARIPKLKTAIFEDFFKKRMSADMLATR
jgi:hypothetical protein